MTQHESRPVEALLVIDVQTAFFAGREAVPDGERVLDRSRDLIDRARTAGALVVHLQNDGPPGAVDEPGTPGWELHLPVRSDDPRERVVRKTDDDGFGGTPLGDLLTGAGVRSLAVCGVLSEMCVSATARTALERGYRVVLPHDGHATYDIPPAPGISERVPAAMSSRAAESGPRRQRRNPAPRHRRHFHRPAWYRAAQGNPRHPAKPGNPRHPADRCPAWHPAGRGDARRSVGRRQHGFATNRSHTSHSAARCPGGTR